MKLSKDHPFQPPFECDAFGGMISDRKPGHGHVLDVRGWGRLTGHGTCGLGLDEEDAAQWLGEFGAWVTEAMNEKAERERREADQC